MDLDEIWVRVFQDEIRLICTVASGFFATNSRVSVKTS